MLKVFTAFTGVGSQEMALRNIGIDFEIVGISEVDKNALIGYDAIHNNKEEYIAIPSKEEMLNEIKSKNIAYNFSTSKSEIPRSEKELIKLYLAHKRSKNYGDIRLINEKELPCFDLFTYSYPCKSISVAGKQAGLEKNSGTQSSLLWECERIITQKKPKYLMMENVKNLVGKRHIEHFKEWIKVLDDLGYDSYWKVLNGKNFGVPQNRERVIMISILKPHDIDFKMPISKNIDINLQDILELNVDNKYYISKHRYEHITENLPHQDISYCIDANYHKGTSVDNFIIKRRRQLIQVGNLDNKIHSNTRIYSNKGIAPTLNSMNGGNRQPKILCDFKVRKLTPLECWRLMGYTDEDFYKAKNAGLADSKLYERAGRGIVVPMLEEIFKTLFYHNNN